MSLFIKKRIRTNECEGGYVLLLSVLIASIILAIAVGIANLTLKGIVLANVGKNSHFAFYAADTGGECALYWDIQADGGGSVFATSSESNPPTSGVICIDQDIAQSWSITADATSATTEFQIDLSGGRCAQVFVRKTTGGANTVVESHGFNECSGGAPAQRVERILKVDY